MDEQVRAEARVGPYGQIQVCGWCSTWDRTVTLPGELGDHQSTAVWSHLRPLVTSRAARGTGPASAFHFQEWKACDSVGSEKPSELWRQTVGVVWVHKGKGGTRTGCCKASDHNTAKINAIVGQNGLSQAKIWAFPDSLNS